MTASGGTPARSAPAASARTAAGASSAATSASTAARTSRSRSVSTRTSAQTPLYCATFVMGPAPIHAIFVVKSLAKVMKWISIKRLLTR